MVKSCPCNKKIEMLWLTLLKMPLMVLTCNQYKVRSQLDMIVNTGGHSGEMVTAMTLLHSTHHAYVHVFRVVWN